MALAAQGFGRLRPAAIGTRQLKLTLDRLQILQIDSVNVFERSHYLPLHARLGGYDRALLDRLLFSPAHGYIEYLPHVACFMPVDMWPLFRWRMDAYREKHTRQDAWVQQNGAMLDWLRTELAARGPLAASEIEHESNVRRGPWWGWSDVKEGLEYLFWWGEVASAGRSRFERRYALAEQVVPAEIREIEVARPDAIRELLRRAAVSYGVGTLRDFADYYRLKGPEVAVAAAELEDAGDLVPVRVAGWERNGRPIPAWRHRDARLPRRISDGALLSPFDPIVWERSRTERMFGFHYRIEIYVPQPKRVYGYYVLPVLLDDEIVGRIDLKSDRQAGVLRAQASWSEGSAGHRQVERIAELLRSAARWQGLEGGVVIEPRGDLAAPLRAVIGGS
ncbi:winged helix-turn-helix domain-containing protein [Naasia lichenicola]|uniref:Winged helix-turn-helix domain-containing protein n=2 Tax=Naasia lichenicola TaxID=2565933 RepID=A0A4S4FI00_9MICO|nr:crosslink repair DNA glycosylase YcaQ family protein [Naasia lichenicola]THG28775.1 winged helix-turn-helix domain-containing protein [Naasia lichenicola]